MAPFEALYGRPYRSLFYWAAVGDKSIVGLNIVEQTTKKVKLIEARMKWPRTARRVMQIGGDEIWSLQLEIMYSLELCL